jgi:hypothetical protein
MSTSTEALLGYAAPALQLRSTGETNDCNRWLVGWLVGWLVV